MRPVLWQTYRPGPHLISTRNLIGLGSWAGCRCVSGRGALVVVGSAIAPVTDLAREGIRGIVDFVLQYALVSKSCWTPIVMVGLMHEVVKSDPVTRGDGTTTAFIFFHLMLYLKQIAELAVAAAESNSIDRVIIPVATEQSRFTRSAVWDDDADVLMKAVSKAVPSPTVNLMKWTAGSSNSYIGSCMPLQLNVER